MKLMNASQYGVPQLRPRVVIVALKQEMVEHFVWPSIAKQVPQSVGRTLYDLMAANAWEQAQEWSQRANGIAPTIVGGSKKHGRPDLGPSRTKKAWLNLCVDGHGIATEAPLPGFHGMPRLTARMVARLQGFPDTWQFFGEKTAAYRQIGNAFPPPVAYAVAQQIKHCLQSSNHIFAMGGI